MRANWEQARELQAARAQLALKQSLVAEKDTIIASLQQRTGQACSFLRPFCCGYQSQCGRIHELGASEITKKPPPRSWHAAATV